MIPNPRDVIRFWCVALIVCGAAWFVMLTQPAMCCHQVTQADGFSLLDLLRSLSPWQLTQGWLLMLVAMMAPMTVAPLLHIHDTTLTRLRIRSYALFIIGYFLVWMAAGLPSQLIIQIAAWAAPGSFGPAVVMGLVALIWQASPIKQRALNQCHDHAPLSVFGWAAYRDVLVMGIRHGLWCVVSCWAAMLLPMILPVGQNMGMAAVTILMITERLDPPAAPSWHLRGMDTFFAWIRVKVVRLSTRRVALRIPT